ncbi:sialate O-acetylesterase [Parapedobacter defluvii]|uniref:Sialate O-acetylesterase n=1 Tax=Parapedobacter defluvii TaxID=2045106 RepID=A0ABQ1L1H7_9SPHI|nr:GDSL-type esterase/lipase family protein [Parapedobacter defluvii]GGC13945.1 sialate O-acetylesterase [Parapedobacter defluvii]
MQYNMLKSISFVVFLLYVANAAAQSTWDSLYRPDIYPFLVEQSRQYSRSENDIIFLGNSITFWGNWTEMLNNRYVRNRGIPGDITYGVLERLPYIAEGHPDRIFIMIGINDLARNIPDRVILTNYRRMIRIIKEISPKTKIYFHTLLPTNESFEKLKSHYGKAKHILDINAELKMLGTNESIQVIDLYKYFVGSDGRLKSVYTWDGVHLTAAGYRLWLDILKENGCLPSGQKLTSTN